MDGSFTEESSLDGSFPEESSLEGSSPEGSFMDGSFLKDSGVDRLCWRGGTVLEEGGGVRDEVGEWLAVPAVGFGMEWVQIKFGMEFVESGIGLNPLLAYRAGSLAALAVDVLVVSSHCHC